MKKWRAMVHTMGSQIDYYRALLGDSNTPAISRWLLVMAVAYLLSPIDIIPDFIPVLGQLDDLIIVPALIVIALVFIPASVKADIRFRQSSQDP